MIKEFHLLFRALVYSDDTPPLELLTERLQGMALDKRTSCMRYLLAEYENRQLEFLHKLRAENDSSMLQLTEEQERSMPSELLFTLMDGGLIIDATVQKVRSLLEEDVPRMLLEAEHTLISLQPDYASPVRQAKEILALAEQEAVMSVSTSKSAAQPTEYLNLQEAAAYLKVSTSKLYKLKGVVKVHKRPSSRTNWYRVEDLEDYKNRKADEGGASLSSLNPKKTDQPTPIVLIPHNRRKGKK